MTKRWFSAALVAVAGAGALYVAFAAVPPASNDQPGAQPRESAGAISAPNRTPPVSVITAAADKVDFPIRRRTIGTFESPASVIVRARVESLVREQHFADGQMVAKGDRLYTLDDRELKAMVARDEAQLEKDKAAVARTAANLERIRELAARNVASQQALEQATAEHKAAVATVAADQAQLDLDRTKLGYATISAPIDGRLGASRVSPGALVGGGDTTGLVTVTQIAPIRLSFALPESDAADLRAALARPAKAMVRAYTPGQAGLLATGELSFVDSTIDTGSGTILAKASFANKEMTLWPGQYVDVEIDLDVRRDTVTVPTVAVQSGQNGPYVFVAKPDQTVEIRNVALAGADGDRTAIATGLAGDERVVIEGQLRLANGARISEDRRSEAGERAREAQRQPGPSTPVRE